MPKRWQWKPSDVGAIEDLAQQAQISPILAHMLLARGLKHPAAVAAFLDPKLTDLHDPNALPGVPAAADRLMAAIAAQEPIVVYGDYDADGMTATAILIECLRAIGGDVTYYVPNRLEDGYGLSREALTKLAARGKRVVVSVDCGIGAIDEARLARELGMDLIVTDHHQCGAELPDVTAIVHPALPGTNYPFHGLCGAGVALKLGWALAQRASGSTKVRPELRELLMQAIGLAAIGTIADVVPLLDENRALVKHGLVSLAQRPGLGLSHLLKVTKLTGRSHLESDHVAFTIGPRLNAAGRLGQAQLAVELMTTRDPSRAEALAVYIDRLNSDRDTLERSVQAAAAKQAKEQMDADPDAPLVLAGAGWHVGVIGIVAGRLAEKYHRPTIVIALDTIGRKAAVGSARSACGVNLHECLEACRPYLVSCGGHAAAAGLRVEESRLEAFRQAFCEVVAERLQGVSLEPELHIDAEAVLPQLDIATVTQLDKLGPFGSQNPRPVLAATGVSLVEAPRTMGSGDRHFSARFTQHGSTIRAVAFGKAEWIEPLTAAGRHVDIAFRPTINDYNGYRQVQLQVIDWRPSTAPNAEAAPSGPHWADAPRSVADRLSS